MSSGAAFSAADPGREAWALMLQLFKSQRRVFAAIAAEAELGPSQLQFLLNIKPAAALPMSELAELLYCDASYITSIVDKLEGRGLLERRASLTDRRVKLIALTAGGAEMHRQLMERVFTPPAAISELSGGDRQALRDIMDRALKAVTTS